MKKNGQSIKNSKLKRYLKLLAFALTVPGISIISRSIKKRLRRSGIFKAAIPDYNKWASARLETKKLETEYNAGIVALAVKPEIVILIIVTKTDTSLLNETINSVTAQIYSNWQGYLYVAPSAAITQLPANIDQSRLTLIPSLQEVSKVTAPYLVIMSQDALLTPNCLYEFVKEINTHPAHQLAYTDEDVLTAHGKYTDHYFKPNWSPHTLLSRNYVGNTFLISKSLLESAGGLNPEFGEAIAYDLLLRATESLNKPRETIGHIAKVLHHNPLLPASQAYLVAAQSALSQAMIRRSTPAVLELIPATKCFDINYTIAQPCKVSIIIPTCDQEDLLKVALDSIVNLTNYANYEIIVVNNNSISAGFYILMKEYGELLPGRFKCIEAPYPFNFSRLINDGAAAASGEYLLLLNNDVEITQPDWLTRMVAYAQLPETGAVGPKLLYPDGNIQHAGIVLGIDGHSGHAFAHKPGNDPGYQNSVSTNTNYAAVTGACLMVLKSRYIAAGGMNEELPVEYNDIDLCLKLYSMGYYNVYLSSVVLYHHESATRGHPFRSIKSYRQHEHDLAIFKNKWQHFIDNDPFYNPNLSLKDTRLNLKS